MPAMAWAIQLAATVVLLENFVPMASLSVSMARTAVWRVAGKRGPMSSREVGDSARPCRSRPLAGRSPWPQAKLGAPSPGRRSEAGAATR